MKLQGKEIKLKDNYPLKVWGELLEIFAPLNEKDELGTVIELTKGGKLERVAELITGEKFSEFTEQDLPVVIEIINGFFTRKKNLLNILTQNSNGSKKNSEPPKQ